MLSFNHYAYGAVGAWLYGTIAGLQLIEPGFRRFRVSPRPGGGVQWAEAQHESPYGPIDIRWELHGDDLKVEVGVPSGTTADVVLPSGGATIVQNGRHTISASLPNSGS